MASSMKKVAFFIVLLIVGCKPPDRTTPQSAFARLAKCIDNADEKCLFTELERDSRWSCHTIYKTLVEMRQIVETSYPANMVRGAYGSWFEEAQSANPEELFAIYCGKRRCLEEIAQGFGAIVKITPAGGNAVLVEDHPGTYLQDGIGRKKMGACPLYGRPSQVQDKAP